MPLVSTSRQEVTPARYIPRVSEHFHHIMLKDRIAWALGLLLQCFSGWFIGFYSEGSMFHSVEFRWKTGLEFSSPHLMHKVGCTFHKLNLESFWMNINFFHSIFKINLRAVLHVHACLCAKRQERSVGIGAVVRVCMQCSMRSITMQESRHDRARELSLLHIKGHFW